MPEQEKKPMSNLLASVVVGAIFLVVLATIVAVAVLSSIGAPWWWTAGAVAALGAEFGWLWWIGRKVTREIYGKESWR